MATFFIGENDTTDEFKDPGGNCRYLGKLFFIGRVAPTIRGMGFATQKLQFLTTDLIILHPSNFLRMNIVPLRDCLGHPRIIWRDLVMLVFIKPDVLTTIGIISASMFYSYPKRYVRFDNMIVYKGG